MTPIDSPRDFLQDLYTVAVARALPQHLLAAHLPSPPRGRTLVVGAGKAGGAMAAAFDAAWSAEAPLSGLVITRYGEAFEEISVLGTFALTRDATEWDDFVPLVYVAVADDIGRAREVHRLVWSQGVVPFLLIVCTDEVWC